MFIKKPYKVAVIDDSSTICTKVLHDLKPMKEIEPIAFMDPAVALEEIRKQQIRIVICDINMPEMYGDQLLRECMAMKMGISVYMLTASESFMMVDRCMMVGARGFLHKPTKTNELRMIIKEAVTHLDRWNEVINAIVSNHKNAGHEAS